MLTLIPHAILQEIASQYYTSAQDFIPLTRSDWNPPKARPAATKDRYKQRRKSLRLQKFSRPENPGGPSVQFNVKLPDNLNFGASQPPRGKVFRFHGRQNEQQRVPSPVAHSDAVYSTEEKSVEGLRPIVIDGSNIAYAHGRSSSFSARGIELVVNYFKERGHKLVVAFLPQYRINDLLSRMEKEGTVIFTPSRKVGGKKISSYDDR